VSFALIGLQRRIFKGLKEAKVELGNREGAA